MADIDPESMKVDELKAELKERGLPTSGRKVRPLGPILLISLSCHFAPTAPYSCSLSLRAKLMIFCSNGSIRASTFIFFLKKKQ
jgi:hypothetical protein